MYTLRKATLALIILMSCLSTHLSFGQVDFREETIYFLLTSRFFDGDPSNNAPNEWSSYDPDPNVRPSITDPQDVTWRGDFKGLIQKLDYIQDLGFTAIWITPIVHNRSPLDYHGYHAWDFTRVDPRLESPGATFQDLINEVHARGMKIVLDIVTNHAGRFGIKGQAEIKYNTDPNQPWGQDSNGNTLQPNPNWEYDGITPNPDDGKIWSRANIPTMPAPYNQNLQNYNWPSTQSYVDTSDPNWYHHSGNGFAQGWDDTENLYNRALAGDTPDLNTGSSVVQNYLIAAYTTFINMGVDAFRWDTMKHMSKDDVLAFKDAFHAVNPDLFIFGEVAQKRHELHNVEEINPHWYTWRGAVGASQNSDIAVLDFYAEATFHGVFESGESFANVQAAARYDHLYSDPSTLLTWLDNHDFGPNNDWNRRYGGSAENLAACMNFMFTWRGIPVVYYGTEIQFKKGEYADIHDATGIEKSIDETGRAYYGAEFANAPNHIIYQHIKKLNAMRRAIPALQKGAWRWDGNAGGNGVGYVRSHGSSEVAVGLAKDGSATFNFSGLTNGIYRDAVTGNEQNVSNGSLSFTVQSGSAGIYVLNGPGMIGGNGVGFFQAGSGSSQPVVSANPSGGVYSNPVQVTLSASSQHAPNTIYYTLDGSTPSTSSAVYSGALTISSTSTLKAMAVDNQGGQSTVLSHTYTIGAIEGITVYFQKPSGWSTANIHYWNLSPSGASSTWPGPTMTSEGNGWYRYDFTNASSANIVFNDNGGAQTADLSRSSDGWYDINGVWNDTDPRVTTNQPPVVSISPLGGTFTDGDNVSVTLSATDDSDPNPTIYYTLNGSTPTTASSVYSTALSVSDDLTIKALAVDSQGASSTIVSAAFTFEPPASGLIVHFKPNGYTSPEVYFWGATPSSQTTTWPGETMTAEADGWYSYTIGNAACSNLIFSNNGASQTADLYRCGEGWYMDGTWYDDLPGTSAGLTIHYQKPSGWGTAKMHYWNVTPSSVAGTTWPGAQMTNDGNGWWSYTIADATCASIVFNDNGGAQTGDLSRCGEGWYNNGWSGSARTSEGFPKVENAGFSLSQNYPNPFTDFTTIEMSLNKTQNVRLSVYAMDGKEVMTIVDHELTSGKHRFILNADQFEPGIYFYKIISSEGALIKRMLVK